MRLRTITEQKVDRHFFNYTDLSDDMWHKKVQAAKKDSHIDFDLENDEATVQRVITIDQTHWEHSDCKFKCELHHACGDWQEPIIYFRCQLISGYAKDLNTDKSLIYIPDRHNGNDNLRPTDHGGWEATDDHNVDTKPNERQAWQALHQHLKTLVDEEIKAMKAGAY